MKKWQVYEVKGTIQRLVAEYNDRASAQSALKFCRKLNRNKYILVKPGK